MLCNASHMREYAIDATDGSVGTLSDLLFDETGWSVRWLVVDTGTWLTGRKVLLPPDLAGEPRPAERRLPVSATRQQVEDSPGIDADAPVSRQHEHHLHDHYGVAPYWVGYPLPGPTGATAPVPSAMIPAAERVRDDAPPGDPALRSARAVTGYNIRATDGEIGHVEDFLVDPDGWAVRYLVVDTRNWWPGNFVLVVPGAITTIDWSNGRTEVNLTRGQIEGAPEYDPAQPVDRAYEERYFDYYGYPLYWSRPVT